MSNEPTIEQMDLIIARFMGMKGSDEFIRQNYHYHKRWDLFMPVVKKIYDTLADMLKSRPPHTACQGDLIEIDIHCAIREVDILKAHGFVYQFCEWYNKKEDKQ